MILGFLLIDVLLWAVLPLALLLLLWGDKKAWAATLTVVGIAALAWADWSKVSTNIVDPIWWGNLVKWVVIYAGVGAGFTFLKWKVMASKTARSFAQFLDTWNMEPNATDVNRRVANGATEEEATAYVTGELRRQAADKFNGSYSNPYRQVLRVKDENGTWKSSYDKWVLGQYVTSWVVYWPFYTVLLVLDDLIRHIADWFVEVFGKGYQKLSDASFASIK